MSSTIIITPPPGDDGEGIAAPAPKARITSVTVDIPDGLTAAEIGHEVAHALKAVEHFNAG